MNHQTLSNGTKIEFWLKPSEVDALNFSSYWNDESQEEGKPYEIKKGDTSVLETYLADSRLADDLDLCLNNLTDVLDQPQPLSGRGIDIACGNLWATAQVFRKHPLVEYMTCMDYSLHRLTKLAPKVIDAYKLPAARITLAHGSFYEIRDEDSSFDFAILSQAFHHADEPKRLLAELHRVLKPQGIVIIIGEHLLNERRQKPETDPILGDHFYYQREYQELFEDAGFRVKQAKNPHSPLQAFILNPRP